MYTYLWWLILDYHFILVTGASGFVGSHMIDLLVSKGHHIRAADVKDFSYPTEQKYVTFVKADITKREALRGFFDDVEYAFHIASVFDYWASWDILYKVNVEGTRNLCEEALNSDIKSLVIWSSGAVYGVPKEIPVKETAPLAPVNDYEKSKAEQEKVAMQFFEENGLPVIIIRPASIYGPRSKYGTTILLFMLAKGQLPAIPGCGKYIPALVHVADVVNAAYFLAEKKEAIGDVFNIADDSKYTIEELLLAAAEMIGVKIRKFHIPLWLLKTMAYFSELGAKITGKRPRIEKEMIRYLTFDSLMDNTKIKNLGYKLIYPDAMIGLQETMEWYKKEGWI